MNGYEEVRPGDPFERWHQVTCRNYSVTECRPVRDKAFSADVSVRPFGDLMISRISSQVDDGVDLKVTRSRIDIRKDYRDDFLIWVGRAGHTVLEQAGRRVQLKAGDLSLHDQAAPFSLSFSQRSAATMIIVPRHLMLARLPHAEQCVALPVRAQSAIARLAAATISEAALQDDAATSPNSIGDLVWNGSLDIWVGAIQTTCTPVEIGPRARRQTDRLRTVQRYMMKRLHDPELDLSSAAADLHMSNRTIVRLFAVEATTPMHWLRQERLKACHDALSRGQFERVGDAAFAYGFRSASHFSRAFKNLYGINAQQLVRNDAP